MKILGWLVACLFFVGCATTPDAAPSPESDSDYDVPMPSKKKPPERESKEGAVDAEFDEPIDYLGLHRHLGLERAKDDLGYLERAFDTCRVGYGHSASNRCRRDTFIAIRFQILCRDSQGTISTALAREDMKPLSGRALNWTIQNSRGSMRLDGEGFGQILATFSRSPRTQRLKLAVDNDFVYVRAGEVKRLVTPSNWCN